MGRALMQRPIGKSCVLVLAVALLGSCASQGGTAALGTASATGAQLWAADRLYFGREIPAGGTVSEEQWTAFLGDVVTPRLPDGFTVWRAQGQWLDPRGTIVQESVFVLEVFHPGNADTEAAIHAIATEYKRRFGQDAVLRVSVPVQIRFYD